MVLTLVCILDYLSFWLLLSYSLEECGRYLETIKVYENKPADIIQGQLDTDYLSRVLYFCCHWFINQVIFVILICLNLKYLGCIYSFQHYQLIEFDPFHFERS